MEAQTYLLVIIPLFFLLHWLVKYYKLNPNVSYKLPPGPKKLPIIGNLHQLAEAGSLPHHALRDLAKIHGPLMHLQLGEISAVVASSPEMAKEIVKTHDASFLQRPHVVAGEIMTYGGLDIAYAPYGDHWRQMRKMFVAELLSTKRVQSFSSIREEEAAKFKDSILKSVGSPINLTSRISSLIQASISRVAFGGMYKERDEFVVSLIRKIMESAAGFDIADVFPSIPFIFYITGKMAKMNKLHKQVDKLLENIIKEHQQKKKPKNEGAKVDDQDFIDLLLRIQQDDTLNINMTTNIIKALIIDIFGAGTDTSSSTLEWAMVEMMRNPRVREKAQAELRQAFRGKEKIHESDLEQLSYLKLVIKETLRLHPPTPLLLPRECSQLTIIDGYAIPTKTKVIVNAYAICRDPQYWIDSEKFFPERFEDSSIDFKGNNFEYLPFGGGRRICPGITLGLASMMLPLALLLYHFNWELPNNMKPEDIDMDEDFGLTVTRKNEWLLIPFVNDL